MKKFILIAALLFVLLLPGALFASPGALDQYGGHYCYDNCSTYNLPDKQYHYHNIVDSPGYLTGYLAKPAVSYLFYQPQIEPKQLISQPDTLANSSLAEDSYLDAQYCSGEIFAPGIYDEFSNVRVKPVCAEAEAVVRSKAEILPADYYKELPDSTKSAINNVYHYEINALGKKVYTDRPLMRELSGLIIQGETDNIIYYIYPKDYTLKLRPITAAKAESLFGPDYQAQLVYFDDSIIYSYPIGLGLN